MKISDTNGTIILYPDLVIWKLIGYNHADPDLTFIKYEGIIPTTQCPFVVGFNQYGKNEEIIINDVGDGKEFFIWMDVLIHYALVPDKLFLNAQFRVCTHEDGISKKKVVVIKNNVLSLIGLDELLQTAILSAPDAIPSKRVLRAFFICMRKLPQQVMHEIVTT